MIQNDVITSPWREAQNIAEHIALPEIPAKDCFIEIRPGEDIRPVLQSAMDQCSANGGGRVIVPRGVYRCDGPLLLRSFTELHFEDGAVIKFSPHPEHYLPQVFTRWEGVEIFNLSPAIYGKNLTDTAVTGNGTLVGGCEIFSSWVSLQKEAVERCRSFSVRGIPVEKRYFSEQDHLRPSMFQTVSCKRVLIEGITLMNTAFWMFHPLYCKDVTFRNVTCDSMYVNNDGIDVDSCENVLIENSFFRNGDDAVAIKSGRDHDGWRVGCPTKNVVIRNCHIFEALHGVAIGSELSGGADGIYIHDISMGTIYRQAIQFKSNRDRGGSIRNVKLRNISVECVQDNLIYFCSSYPGARGGNAPTEIRDFELENIKCNDAFNVFHFQGTPEFPLHNVNIRNVTVDSCETVYACRDFMGNTVLSEINLPVEQD